MIMHPATTTSYDTSDPRDVPTDTFEFDPSGIKSSSSAIAPHHPDRDDQDDGLPISTMPGCGQASPGSALSSGDQGSGAPPFPTMQMMERPDSSTSYRIPSSIFRTKSSTPGDWSVASNESLFSIYTGNASFTREQLAWMERSDEQTLLRSDTELFFSGPLLDFSGYATPSNQQAVAEAEEQQQQQPQPGLSVNVTAPKSGELPLKKKAKSLNADELTKEISLAKGVAHSPASSRVSDDGSCKSFAFPVFARNDTSNDTSGLETLKQPVVPPGHSRKPTEPSSAKTKQEPEPEPEVQPAKKPEAGSTSAASFSCCAWFSCFKGCGAAPRS